MARKSGIRDDVINIIEDAISESIQRDKIVPIYAGELLSATWIEITDYLDMICDDYGGACDAKEYWGMDGEHSWRIRLEIDE